MKCINKTLFFCASLLMLIGVSCNIDFRHSSGGTAEILVVTQNNEQWEGIIGDTIPFRQ